MLMNVPEWLEGAFRGAHREGNSLIFSPEQVDQTVHAFDRPRTAAERLGATPADIPGLWNLPGHPELTTGQLLDLAARS